MIKKKTCGVSSWHCCVLTVSVITLQRAWVIRSFGGIYKTELDHKSGFQIEVLNGVVEKNAKEWGLWIPTT